MKSLSILMLTTTLSLPLMAYADADQGNFYSNLGATLISNNAHDESAYFVEVGYSHQLDQIFSVDVNYKKVSTFDANVTESANDFSQHYDTYGLGVRADQQLGALSLYAKAGASFVVSELTTWDSVTATETTEEDNSFKPYASAGVNIASPYDQRIAFGAAVTYQMLPNNEHATSFSGGVNYAF